VPSRQRSAAFKIAYFAITGLTLYYCITTYFSSRCCYIFINPVVVPPNGYLLVDLVIHPIRFPWLTDLGNLHRV
jgi:hypothetical protein